MKRCAWTMRRAPPGSRDCRTSYRPALDRILGIESSTSQRKLNNLELRLRSCRRGVGVLVLAEFDRRR
jgi:hypothetical protein